ADELETSIKEARSALEGARAIVADLDIARATAETDLAHLASTCVETVQATLDEVLADVEQLEREGGATPDARLIAADEPDEESQSQESRVESQESRVESRESDIDPGAVEECAQRTLTAEEAITALRGKIDRLGPVN